MKVVTLVTAILLALPLYAADDVTGAEPAVAEPASPADALATAVGRLSDRSFKVKEQAAAAVADSGQAVAEPESGFDEDDIPF